MSEKREDEFSEQPDDRYEAPQVEQVEAEDLPAVTAAGNQSDEF